MILKKSSIAFGLWAMAATCGCGTNGPELHSVSGIVIGATDKISAIAGSSVEISLKDRPTVRGFGQIEPDGAFEIQSLHLGELRGGALEGEYNLRLLPNDEDEESRKRALSAFSKKYLQFETSGLQVIVPASDPIEIRL